LFDQQTIAEFRRYINKKQLEIDLQRSLIDNLEKQDDARALRDARKSLSEMIKTLDSLLAKLRPVIDHSVHNNAPSE
jgi:hypothetical protein